MSAHTDGVSRLERGLTAMKQQFARELAVIEAAIHHDEEAMKRSPNTEWRLSKRRNIKRLQEKRAELLSSYYERQENVVRLCCGQTQAQESENA